MWAIKQKKGMVSIRDTDATGRVYCPRPMEWVIQAFEESCYKNIQIKQDIAIVRAKVEFFEPNSWMDPYDLYLSIERVGNRSFDLMGSIFKGEKKTVEVLLTFVVPNSSEEFLKMAWGEV